MPVVDWCPPPPPLVKSRLPVRRLIVIIVPGTNPVKAEPQKPLRVLVVEDDELIAMDLTSGLRHLGYEVLASAATGGDALRAAKEHLPDVVLMDVSLSGELSGTQAGQRISECCGIPIIYVTGYANPATLEEIRIAGGGQILEKPVRVSDIDRAIQLAISRDGPAFSA